MITNELDACRLKSDGDGVLSSGRVLFPSKSSLCDSRLLHRTRRILTSRTLFFCQNLTALVRLKTLFGADVVYLKLRIEVL